MTLHLYLARRFGRTLLVTTVAFAILVGAIEAVEIARALRDAPAAGSGATLQLMLLTLPGRLYEIGPLIVLLAALALFLSLSRQSELAVARTSGRSALGLSLAPAAVTLALGALLVAGFNPVVAATLRKAEAVEARFEGAANVLSISAEGLWLRQGDADGQTVIRARSASLDGERLRDVTFLGYGPDGPSSRIEASGARLSPGLWHLTNAKRWNLAAPNPEAAAEVEPDLTIPTELTIERIRDGFGTPEAINIWDLPAFIADLELAGFSARAHRTRLWSEAASPLFLAAMALVGLAFVPRHPRGGGAWTRGGIAVLTGFALYFVKDFALALGQSGQAPVLLAALAPPAAALAVGATLVLWADDA